MPTFWCIIFLWHTNSLQKFIKCFNCCCSVGMNSGVIQALMRHTWSHIRVAQSRVPFFYKIPVYLKLVTSEWADRLGFLTKLGYHVEQMKSSVIFLALPLSEPSSHLQWTLSEVSVLLASPKWKKKKKFGESSFSREKGSAANISICRKEQRLESIHR